MHEDIAKILITEEDIRERTQELGTRISEDYAGTDLMLICVLKGGFMFLSDLLRAISVPLSVDFMATSSYGAGIESSGVVRILKDLDVPIEGRNILIVEDIIDTGHTLDYLLRILDERQPASLRICTLLNKPDREVWQLAAARDEAGRQLAALREALEKGPCPLAMKHIDGADTVRECIKAGHCGCHYYAAIADTAEAAAGWQKVPRGWMVVQRPVKEDAG